MMTFLPVPTSHEIQYGSIRLEYTQYIWMWTVCTEQAFIVQVWE
jgi:hypothetical protein